MRWVAPIKAIVMGGRETPKSLKIASNFGTMKYITKPTIDCMTSRTQNRYIKRDARPAQAGRRSARSDAASRSAAGSVPAAQPTRMMTAASRGRTPGT